MELARVPVRRVGQEQWLMHLQQEEEELLELQLLAELHVLDDQAGGKGVDWGQERTGPAPRQGEPVGRPTTSGLRTESHPLT